MLTLIKCSLEVESKKVTLRWKLGHPEIFSYWRQITTFDYIGFSENGSNKSSTVYLHLSPNCDAYEIL
jgi:hypothetical protein